MEYIFAEVIFFFILKVSRLYSDYWIERIFVFVLHIILKSELWFFSNCLRLVHEYMVYPVCVTIFWLKMEKYEIMTIRNWHSLFNTLGADLQGMWRTPLYIKKIKIKVTQNFIVSSSLLPWNENVAKLMKVSLLAASVVVKKTTYSPASENFIKMWQNNDISISMLSCKIWYWNLVINHFCLPASYDLWPRATCHDIQNIRDDICLQESGIVRFLINGEHCHRKKSLICSL